MKNEISVLGFKIENFRSIVETDWIKLEDRITVLAGKNESGKTTVLKALSSFSDDNFTSDDIPVNNKNANPAVEVDIEMNYTYLNRILGIEIFNKGKYILKTKRSLNVPDEYSGEVYDIVCEYFTDSIPKIIMDKKELLLEKVQALNFSEDFKIENLIELAVNILINMLVYNSDEDYFKTEIINNGLTDSDFLDNSSKKDILISFRDLLFKILYNQVELINKWENIIPKFVYFDSFDEKLPDEIDYTQLENEEYLSKNRGFVNLLGFLKISVPDFVKQLNLNPVRQTQGQLREYSTNITGNFSNIYSQETININLTKDNNTILLELFDTNDDINSKKPSQRSKGFQWFLSFYLLFNNLENIESKILLIDEPGLNLHAKAQTDILKFFEEKIENNILYTTHSPFLLDADNMHRVKLVINDKGLNKGTIIKNKYYSGGDIDTQTPINVALGYNISKSPIDLGTGLNVITEGISDRYYLLAFYKLFSLKDELHIIPAIGATQTNYIASISIGWGLDFLVLLDTDKKGREAKRQLSNLFVGNEELEKYVISVSEKTDETIESLFATTDSDKTWFKDCGRDKVGTSLEFYKNVSSGKIKKEDLNEVTLENFSKLFKKIGIK